MTIDPVQLAHGVTVTVNVPQMPQVCPAPEAPTPGGVTVPVQGGLTAEQFAHIVATVTAKVVEELGGEPGSVTWDAVQDKPDTFPPETHEHPIDQIDGLRTSLDSLASDVANRSEIGHRHNAADIDDLPSGGGGAGIDDTTIGTDTTWSSQKTSDELAGKADDKSWMIDTDTGDLMPGPFPSLSYQVALAYAWANLALKATSEFGDGTVGGVEIVSTLPEYPSEGTLYAVRVSDGTISWHMPNIGG